MASEEHSTKAWLDGGIEAYQKRRFEKLPHISKKPSELIPALQEKRMQIEIINFRPVDRGQTAASFDVLIDGVLRLNAMRLVADATIRWPAVIVRENDGQLTKRPYYEVTDEKLLVQVDAAIADAARDFQSALEKRPIWERDSNVHFYPISRRPGGGRRDY